MSTERVHDPEQADSEFSVFAYEFEGGDDDDLDLDDLSSDD